jgi:competence protein ComEC
LRAGATTHRPSRRSGPSTTGSADDEQPQRPLDVGQGDATLLTHADATILIDTGRHHASDVVAYLRSLGVDSTNLVVITHPHADHIRQFDQVIDAVPVDEVWWSGSTTTSQTFERAVAALDRSDADYEEPRAGDVTTVGKSQGSARSPAWAA